MNALPAAVFLSFLLSTSHAFGSVGATSDVFAIPNGAISFKDRSDLLDLPKSDGKRVPYRGETWSLTWGDANSNRWPDLYLNHHFHAGSHLVFDLGVDGIDWSYVQLDQYRKSEIVPSDQHSAVFADVNGDGKEDIYETVGGKFGMAEATDELTKNNLFIAGVGGFTPNSTADDYGLSYPAARGRMAIPINLNNNLALLVTNLPREDRLFPTSTFVRSANGTFVEDLDVFKSRWCLFWFCSIESAADLHGYSLAITGHLDGDDNLAVYSGKEVDNVYLGDKVVAEDLSIVSDVTEAELTGSATRAQRIEAGGVLYNGTCSVCHQQNGEGLEGVFPPLANSDYLMSDTRRAIEIVCSRAARARLANSAASS